MGMKDRRQWRFSRFMAASALACSLLSLASCRLSLPGDCSGKCAPSSPPPSAVLVDFDTSISYVDALRELTDLGVQPAVFCGFQSDMDAGTAIRGSVWLPAGQRQRFQQEQRMWVMETIAASAGDWSYRMYHTPGFHRDPSLANYSCTDGGAAVSDPTYHPGAPEVLTMEQIGSQIGTYAYVTFVPSVDYDAALFDVSNLGLRLADPCYEQSHLPHHQAQPWHLMGQEITFSYSHALVVAPAPLISATVWRDQLRKLPDVAEEISYHPVC
jgi:hypothetical protein